MDWNAYTERRKRHDRWIVAGGIALVLWIGAGLTACAVYLARVS